MKIKSRVNHYFILIVVIVISFGSPILAADLKVDKGKKISSSEKNNKIIVYYFHGNMRCRTCRTIETLTRKAVEDGFSDDLKKGIMELSVINLDKSENSHFVKDYQLLSRSVVVSNLKNGKENNWKRLDRVWELVKNDTSFISYVQKEIHSVMKGEN